MNLFMTEDTNRKKYKGITGYSLHNKRLEYTGKSSIRSIKYPLIPNNWQIYHSFCDDIINDYERINGAVNITTYAKNPKIYSLFDFWIDSLRTGVIFRESANSLKNSLEKLRSKKSTAKISFDLMKVPAKKKLDSELFINKFVLSTGVRSTSTKQSLENKLLGCFKEKYRTNADVKKIAKKISSDLLPNRKALSQTEQKKFWHENYNLQIPAKKEKSSRNLTFYILPELELDKNLSVLGCIKRLKSIFDKENAKYLGLTSNFNAFSNYLNEVFSLFYDNKLKRISAALKEISKDWEGREDGLIKRLEFLSQKSRLLGKPRLTKSWADYRSVWGGKLQSWYSGFDRQASLIRKAIKDNESELTKLKKEVVKPRSSKKKRYLFQKKNLTRLIDHLLKLSPKIKSKNNLEFAQIDLYRDLLSQLRINLNEFYQKFLQTKKDKKEGKAVDKVYKSLFKNLRLVPDFFGESKKKNYEKYIFKTIPIIKQGIAITHTIEGQLLRGVDFSLVTQDYFYRQLEKINCKLRSNALNSSQKIHQFQNIIKTYNKGILSKKDEVFYKSQYSNNKKLKLIAWKNLNYGEELKKIYFKLKEEYSLNKSPDKLLDYIEILKIRIGWLLFLSSIRINTSEFDFSLFEKAKTYSQNFGSILKGEDRSFFIMSLILSEIRGAASLFSRKFFTARYVAQIINSEKKFPLIYIPKKKNDKNITLPSRINRMPDSNKKLLNKIDTSLMFFYPHQWGVVIPRNNKEITNGKESIKTIDFTGKNSQGLKVDEHSFEQIFNIYSSKYQIHFLDRLLYKTKKWKKISLALSEPFLIVEEEVKVKWNLVTSKPELLTDKNKKLFISIPFNLNPETKWRNQNKIIEKRNNYIGIDVGEYGLAWAVVSFREKNPKIIDKGFVFDPVVRKIADRIQDIKESQTKGTFGVPSTALARVRENAIKSLRNKIHYLALKYNAKIIFEYQINNFETGSNRVSKVYRSVKVSDVKLENKADELVKNQVWGNYSKYIGNHISAYATSYTCTKCYRSIYDECSKDKRYLIVKKWKNILDIKINKSLIAKGYTKKQQINTGDKLSYKVTMNALKGYARPPANSEALSEINIQEKDLQKFVTKRGNCAIFICPFCGHVADADIQAALNIACRGYLRDNKTKKFDYLEAMKIYMKNVKFPIVSLEYIQPTLIDKKIRLTEKPKQKELRIKHS